MEEQRIVDVREHPQVIGQHEPARIVKRHACVTEQLGRAGIAVEIGPGAVLFAIELRLELELAGQAETDQARETRVLVQAQDAAVARFLDRAAEQRRQQPAALACIRLCP